MKTKIFKERKFLVSGLMIGSLILIAQQVHAHGSMKTPVSRVYNCLLGNPENPKSEACKAAVEASGTQGFYDWNGINQLPAGDHQAFVPDGQLCSGGKPSHAGLDLTRTDWVATPIAPNLNGQITFTYLATAPHSTDSHELYITKQGYDATQPLKFSDLEGFAEEQPFCELPEVPLENGEYRLTCPFPTGKSGKHVIYHIWQRDDSAEAFYACVDVTLTSDATPTDFQLLGNIRAEGNLPVNSIVTLRLFDGAGQDIDTFFVILEPGNNTAARWPLALAQAVNGLSTLVNVGVLNGDGEVTPIESADGNLVFVRSTETFRFDVDIEVPDPSDPNPNPDPAPDPSPDPGPDVGEVDFNYPDGIASYTAGTIVLGTNGKRYQCRPFPNSGWCTQAPDFYAPGTGLAFDQAWILLADN